MINLYDIKKFGEFSPIKILEMPRLEPAALNETLFDHIGPASDLCREHVRQVRADGLLHLAVDLRVRVLLQHPDRFGLRRRTVQVAGTTGRLKNTQLRGKYHCMAGLQFD